MGRLDMTELDSLRFKIEELENKISDLEHALDIIEKRLDNATVDCDISI